MVKKVLLAIVCFGALFAKSNIYERNCVKCHSHQAVSLDKLFYRYLLKYSSERAVKKSLYDYLKHPSYFKTIMPSGYINRYGIKLPSKLSDKDLKRAIDIYWDKYKVFGKLKIKRED